MPGLYAALAAGRLCDPTEPPDVTPQVKGCYPPCHPHPRSSPIPSLPLSSPSHIAMINCPKPRSVVQKAQNRNAHMVTHTWHHLSPYIPPLSGVASPLAHGRPNHTVPHATSHDIPHVAPHATLSGGIPTTPHTPHTHISLTKGGRGANEGGLLHQRSRPFHYT